MLSYCFLCAKSKYVQKKPDPGLPMSEKQLIGYLRLLYGSFKTFMMRLLLCQRFP